MRDDGDLVAKVFGGDVAKIDAADIDGAFGGIVKAEEKIGESRFAGTAGADKGDHLAGPDFQVNAAQDGLLLVREGDVFEEDVGGGGVEGFGVGGFRESAFGGE